LNTTPPIAKVALNRTPVSNEGFIALTEFATPEGVVRLSLPKNIEEFARVIYSALRDGDAKGLKSVVVAEPVGDGLALAIRDRLMRASKGR
jgi:L-threonylcarbamoyladenylate synthase